MITLQPEVLAQTGPAMATRYRQRITIDDAELEYEERGSGEPVLLIHGGILADAFAPLLAESTLTDRFRVISYHRRGFAGSTRAEGEVSMARQAADARALLAHLGIGQAHVVGHSYGGLIALQLAVDAPEVVHSLALLEPPLLAVPSGERLINTAFVPAIERFGVGDRVGAVATVLRGVAGEEGIAALRRAVPGALELAVTDADTFFQTELPALQTWQFGPEEASRIDQPILAVRGANSDSVAPAFGEGIALLQEWRPQTQVIIVPAATHGLPFMNPGALAQGLVAFFTGHPLPAHVAQRDDRAVDLPTATEDSPAPTPPASGPVKLVALYGPPNDVEAFERHYAETHVPLAHRLPGLQRVETARFLGTAQGEAAPYHRIAELWFAGIGQLQAAAVSAEGQALADDVVNFATGGVTVLVAEIDKAGTAIAE